MEESFHTLFYAQIIGVYLIITSIVMLTRADYYREMLTHIKEGSSTVVVAAIFGLILGIFLVFTHNIWIMESEVLVTLVAWSLLIKSVLWLSFPEFMVKVTHKVYSGSGYYLVAITVGLIGFILTTHGFYLFV
jgi:hypothetical protein